MVTSRWPETLWIIRHGESAGNVAREAADRSGADRIGLTGRDVDVALSPGGREQAQALGRWFGRGEVGRRPEVMLVSPYLRAVQTAQIFRENGGAPAQVALCIDERLREKEFGILDGLTTSGIAAIEPEQAEFRRLLGKFYHRPPGGESWCDVIFRMRSLLDTIALHHSGRRVMIVAHQVVVLCLRYIIDSLTEEQILAIDRQGDVANCSITEYRFDPGIGANGGLNLVAYNAVDHIERAPDAVVTAESDRPARAVRG